MNRIFCLLVFLTFFQSAKCQVKALTEEGKQVILYDNGKWQYLDDSTNKSAGTDTIAVNPEHFSKSSKSSFQLKSKVLNAGIYINPDAWTFSPPKSNEAGPEYAFNSKSQKGYALMLTEKIEIDLSKMPYVALFNAQKAALDARIIKTEYRIVNSTKVLCIQLKGTIQGIEFVYLGYYYSNKNGTVQLLAYTSKKLFDDSKKELEDFLNGFVILP